MCPEKCVCGKDQISYLQLETSDQLKLSNDESKGIQKLVLRDSAFQLDKIQKVFPNLHEISLMKSKLITDETQSVDIEKKNIIHFVYASNFSHSLSTGPSTGNSQCNPTHAIHSYVGSNVYKDHRGYCKDCQNFMYKVLTILNLAIGKKYH